MFQALGDGMTAGAVVEDGERGACSERLSTVMP